MDSFVSDITDPVYLFSFFANFKETDEIHFGIPPVFIALAPYSWRLVSSHPETHNISLLSSDENNEDNEDKLKLTVEDLVAIFCTDSILYTSSSGFTYKPSTYEIIDYISNSMLDTTSNLYNITNKKNQTNNNKEIEYPFILIGNLRPPKANNNNVKITKKDDFQECKIVKTGSSSVIISSFSNQNILSKAAESLPPFNVKMEFEKLNQITIKQLDNEEGKDCKLNIKIEMLDNLSDNGKRKLSDEYLSSIHAIDDYLRKLGENMRIAVENRYKSQLTYFEAVMCVRDGILIMLKPERITSVITTKNITPKIIKSFDGIYNYENTEQLDSLDTDSLNNNIPQSNINNILLKINNNDAESKLNALWIKRHQIKEI